MQEQEEEEQEMKILERKKKKSIPEIEIQVCGSSLAERSYYVRIWRQVQVLEKREDIFLFHFWNTRTCEKEEGD